MAKRKFQPAHHATLYDFRDLDIMYKIDEAANGAGVDAGELAELLGFEAEEGKRNIGIRLAWMRRYGMVAFDKQTRHWDLSTSGRRVVSAQLRAPELKVVKEMPDEKMIEVMALVTSRYHRGETMIGNMLRREFLYGTKRR
jgi:hypothetical protein